MKTIYTLGEFRELTKNFKDEDLLVIETTNFKTGDAEDLFPFHIDTIEGITLRDGSKVDEIRLCQENNTSEDIEEVLNESQDNTVVENTNSKPQVGMVLDALKVIEDYITYTK